MGTHAIHVGLVQKRRVREIGAALLRQPWQQMVDFVSRLELIHG
jgi:hypothetical protein